MALRILLLLLLPPMLLFICALIIMWVPLPRPFPPALSGERNLIAAVVTGLLGVVYVAGLGVYVVSTFLRAGRVLDPFLAAEGMRSESYLVFGRRYQGDLDGRGVEITFVPPQALSPAQLNVYVDADLGTRAALGWERPLLDCGNCGRSEAAETDLGGIQVYAESGAENKVERLLSQAALQETVVHLLENPEEQGLREIYLQPERVWLRARPRRMSEEVFRRWLEYVLAVAETGEETLSH